jgi:hypothetical protein
MMLSNRLGVLSFLGQSPAPSSPPPVFQSTVIMDTLPPVLRQDLACIMNKGLFSKVSMNCV